MKLLSIVCLFIVLMNVVHTRNLDTSNPLKTKSLGATDRWGGYAHFYKNCRKKGVDCPAYNDWGGAQDRCCSMRCTRKPHGVNTWTCD